MPLDFLIEIVEYFLFDKRFYDEYAAQEEQTKKEARSKLLRDFQEYKEEFRLFRGQVEVLKFRNLQRKYEFELHLKTEDGNFPFERIYGPLSQYDAKNRQLRWDIEDQMPDKHEEEPLIAFKFQEALELLREDREKLENLKSEIRPFVEQIL